MKKTLFAILVCGVMVLGMTGCRNSKQDNSDDIHSFVATITECEEKNYDCLPKTKMKKNISLAINLELNMLVVLIL
ncbi:MAG: hypothetical protein L6V78_04675 [Clostridium sp.]|nr:MAG: hypothetical protein L6V78_04675 [Clostridium sp.]